MSLNITNYHCLSSKIGTILGTIFIAALPTFLFYPLLTNHAFFLTASKEFVSLLLHQSLSTYGIDGGFRGKG